MDPVTHLLGGALAGRMLAPRGLERRAMAAGALAGIFPDIDYLARLFLDPLDALNLHRGVTHSLLLMPLWALLAGGILSRWPGLPRRRAVAVAAAGITLHVLLDLVTPFGTRILAPLDGRAHTLGTTFVIDPVITLLLAAGLLLVVRTGRPRAGAAALLGVALVVGFQGMQRQQAEALADRWARAEGLAPIRVLALPQPFSAWNWKLVVETEGGYRIAHVHLGGAGLLARFYPAGWPLADTVCGYRPPEAARWRKVSRFGPEPERARAAWHSPALAPFRRFARLPAWYGNDPASGCIWFTDQRFTLPSMRPPFLFAACPQPAGWALSDAREAGAAVAAERL